MPIFLNPTMRWLRGRPSAKRDAAKTFRLSASVAAGAALVLLAGTAGADEIILKNGKIIEGSARETGNRVIIRPWNSEASIVLEADRIETILPRAAPYAPQNEAEAPEAPSAPEAPETRDAANTVIEQPPIMLAPGMPEIDVTYEPAADAQMRAAIESVFPRIIRICVEELGLGLGERIPLHIKIFEDARSFEAYKSQNSDLHYAVEGYYAVQDDSIVVRGNRVRQKMVATIYHEGTHAVLRRELDFIPSWIDEGLAEFFEGFRVHGDSTVVLSPQHNDEWAKRFLYEGSLMPLSEYLQLTNHEWVEIDQNARHMPRIMAWSLISYLMSNEEGRYALRRYIKALKRTTATEALATAYQELDSAYQGGIPALEREWKRWVLEKRKAQTF